jgi:superfamily II DNA or RNA helicase
MKISPGQIIKNITPTEPVIVTKIQQLGASISIVYVGVNTNRISSTVFNLNEMDHLEILTSEGTFNFNGDPIKFKLCAEAERISSAYQFDPLFAVNCSIVDPLPHQVEAVYKFLLPLPKIRFLLADDTGAGKTIMTGLLLKELLLRGTIERILIITPGGLTKQWQEDEMGIKFNIPFTLVNRSLFSADPNIFHTANKIVTSIDFISREDVMTVAGNVHWDLIVFDEAHKLSAYDYGKKQYLSRRYKAAQALAQQCEHILLLTATPHRGRTDTFKMLLQLLDEDIFATDEIASARIKEVERNGINKFFIRRLKEDMKGWDAKPLYKQRFTKTVTYQLTSEEKKLYEAVTNYLTKQKEEARETKNIHVSLALAVMQRRLVSSISAIKNTLFKRWQALQGIVDEINKNPSIWNQKHKLDGFDVDSLDEYDDLNDDERESLDAILSDPKKFRLFTTAGSLTEIQEESKEVKTLFEMADLLYKSQQEEQKFKELRKLLTSQEVIEGSKLVIFTEHKDTLIYLEERLKNTGYNVATIHGGKSVDERRQAQWDFFKPETQILIGTDAAGEGINLQFCKLLINWDIPWNPNRLEQRMGRVHRYGQKENVLVFNMVANNTREGQVLERLLTKLDIIRESMGDDRVYDVIQDVLENVGLDDVFNTVFNGQQTALNTFLSQDNEQLKIKFTEKIKEHREKLAHSTIDFKDALFLKEHSDEKRLQPIYIQLFFEKAFAHMGGVFTEVRPDIYRIDQLPDAIAHNLRQNHNIYTDALRSILFCFNKQIFLDYQNIGDLGKVHYINPGNPVFDSLINVVRSTYREEMIKGTVLVSTEAPTPHWAFFVKSQIRDNRLSQKDESIADERLILVQQNIDGQLSFTSPANLIDLHAPSAFAKNIEVKEDIQSDHVLEWCFDQVTQPQYHDLKETVLQDNAKRKQYLETAFTQVILDIQKEIQELQTRLLLGDKKVQEKLRKKEERIHQLILKKQSRIQNLDLMMQLSPKAPEVLGCAYVIPLTQVEYHQHYGMSRDDEAEAIAMKVAMDFERDQGWTPIDVSANNEGYDIRSVSPQLLKRHIEVKGRSGSDGSVMLSENEMNRLSILQDAAWLYIVINCKSKPELFRLQNPAKNYTFEQKSKGIQFFLPMNAWKSKI